jgi:hypothetical protein
MYVAIIAWCGDTVNLGVCLRVFGSALHSDIHIIVGLILAVLQMELPHYAIVEEKGTTPWMRSHTWICILWKLLL